MSNQEQFVDVPKAFFSFDEQGLFHQCIECERDLLTENCDYVIEKAVRNYPNYEAKDVIFDFAICMQCAMSFQEKMSKESRSTIESFMRKNVDFQERSQKYQSGSYGLDDLLENCIVSQQPISEATEYQMVAFCRGKKLNLTVPPYVISGPVLEELSELISEKTRDEMDDFYQNHFSPSPGLFEPDPRLIFI